MKGERDRPGSDWIPEREYSQIRERVPIVCVDLLPLNANTGAVGLIRRQTFGGGEGWCLIGGAVMRRERLLEAIGRHVRSSLGESFAYALLSEQPTLTVEYFPDRDMGGPYDPRKHAVALTYVASCQGEASPQGEALDFRWFSRDALEKVDFGFDQGGVVQQLLQLLP